LKREVNRSYANIEVTANFLMGDRLPAEHYDSLIELIRKGYKQQSGVIGPALFSV
jgi:hypothetical protein